MNKLIRIVCIVFIFMIFLVPTVFAQQYSPAFIVVTAELFVKNDVKYIELLVKKNEIDDYIEFNMNSYFSESSEISVYEENGYVSYTVHCKNALSYSTLNEEYMLDGAEKCYFNEFGNNHGTDMGKLFTAVKFALLDQNGTVVSVTNEEKTDDGNFFTERNHFLIKGNELIVKHDFIGYTFIPDLGFVIFVFAILVIILINFIKKKRRKKTQGTVLCVNG